VPPVADLSIVPVPRLDTDDLAWLAHEAVEHPEITLGQALTALVQVHQLHQVGGCS
jgi:hypothetical protein